MVAVILKIENDEEVVLKCLTSIKDICTECFILNKNSTDNTLNIILLIYPNAIILNDADKLNGLLIDTSMEFHGSLNSLKTNLRIPCYYNNDREILFLEERYFVDNDPFVNSNTCFLTSSKPFQLKTDNLNDEEKWYNELLKTKEYLNNNQIDRAHLQALKTFTLRPNRIEPIYHVIKYLRIQSVHQRAFDLAKMCQPIPEIPKDDCLAIESFIYEYGLLYEISILAFYVNEKSLGLQTCNILLQNNKCPWHDNIRSNLVFYIQPLFLITTHQEIISKLKPSNWFILNPSLCYFKHNLIINLRCINAGCDFQVLNHLNRRVVCCNEFPLTTINIRQNYDNQQETVVKIQQCPPKFPGTFLGLEDCRMFEYQDQLCFLATSQEYNSNHINQMMLGINDKKLICIQSPNVWRYEKNWLPFEYENKLLAIYSFSPFIILEINSENGNTNTFYSDYHVTLPKTLRGSAGPIWNDGFYYCIVHEVINPGRIYIHRAIRFDKNFKMDSLSHQFKLKGQHNVEYVSGLTFINDEVVIGWGSNDESANLSKLPFSSFLKLF